MAQVPIEAANYVHKVQQERAKVIQQNAARKTIKKFLNWYLVHGYDDFDTALERYIKEEIGNEPSED